MPRFTAILAGLALATALLSTPALTEPLSAERERALAPGATFTECAQCPEMVVVPAGSFAMGSSYGESGRNSWEHPQHVVTLERPFAVGKFEVTVDQFAAFVRDTGYRAGNSCWTFGWRRRPANPIGCSARPNGNMRGGRRPRRRSRPATALATTTTRSAVTATASTRPRNTRCRERRGGRRCLASTATRTPLQWGASLPTISACTTCSAT